MIYYFTPFSLEKNLAKAYNQYMELLQPDDYACFFDGDVMFTTPKWGFQISEVLKEHPDIEFATCLTNRVNCEWQKPKPTAISDNIRQHRDLGKYFWDNFSTQIEDRTQDDLFSGMLFVLKKSLWEKIGGFKKGYNGMLGVDNDFHLRVQKTDSKLYLMKGIYVYHWWRGGDCKDKSHLL